MATPSIFNVKDLPQSPEIANGDFFIVETPSGTMLLDYKNMIVGLDNITFGPLLSAMDNDISSLSAQLNNEVAILNSEIADLSATVNGQVTGGFQDQLNTLNSQVTALQANLDTVTLQVDTNTTAINALSAVITTVMAQLTSVYTTVNINSAGSGWHN